MTVSVLFPNPGGTSGSGDRASMPRTWPWRSTNPSRKTWFWGGPAISFPEAHDLVVAEGLPRGG